MLVVDPHEDWLRFVAFVLERRGHHVATARTPEEASQTTADTYFDVVVCGLIGEATTAVLADAKSHSNARTILLTKEGAELRGLPRGQVDMPLLRPVSISSLVASVESFLEPSPARGDNDPRRQSDGR